MFGNLTANVPELTAAELERYRACYCGLCRSLQARHGELSRLTLNYDMTFLVLLLSSLYEPEEQSEERVCIAHPFKPHRSCRSEISDYCADMNVMLAYYKCLDDWHDDRSPAAAAEAAILRRSVSEIRERYPRQCLTAETSLRKLSELERSGTEDADCASGYFGDILGEIFAMRDDRWTDTLRRMGRAAGRFIYVLDACLDLEADTFRNRYNPFHKSAYGLPDNEQRFRDILKMLIAEAADCFDYLPLVQDSGILKNILCSGLWQSFDRKFSSKEKGESDGTGSV